MLIIFSVDLPTSTVATRVVLVRFRCPLMPNQISTPCSSRSLFLCLVQWARSNGNPQYIAVLGVLALAYWKSRDKQINCPVIYKH